MEFYEYKDLFSAIEKKLQEYCKEHGDEPDCFEGRLQMIIEPKDSRNLTASEIMSIVKEIYYFNRSSHFVFHIKDVIENLTIITIYYKKDKMAWIMEYLAKKKR